MEADREGLQQQEREDEERAALCLRNSDACQACLPPELALSPTRHVSSLPKSLHRFARAALALHLVKTVSVPRAHPVGDGASFSTQFDEVVMDHGPDDPTSLQATIPAAWP